MPPILVTELFRGSPCKTRVWISGHAAEQIERECDDKPEAFLKKLQVFAQGGFWQFEGEEHVPIRHEIGGAYRVRHKMSSRFRLIGFYEDETKRDFIALDGFKKKKPDAYSSAQWRRIEEVAKVKEEKQWKRAED